MLGLLLSGCAAFDEPLTAADCYDDEYFDPLDEMCYPVEEEFDDEEPADWAFDDDEPMTAADCFDDEYFDPVDEMCYLDEALFDLEAEGLPAWLESYAADLLDAEVALSDGEMGCALIVYTVRDSELSDPELGEVFTETEAELQADSPMHAALWGEFSNLIPAEYRSELTHFGVFSDGADGTLAYVEPNPEAPTTWLLVLDPADAANQDDFIYTLIHEYGRVLTLNDRQVPFDEEAYFDEEGDLAEEAEIACPTFFTGEGCAQSRAYISAFYYSEGGSLRMTS